MDIIGNPEDRQSLHLVGAGTLCDCKVCREMDQVKSQISVTESHDEMEIRLSHLKSERNKTHSLINKRLPPETLSTVFTYCVPSARQLESCFKQQRQYPQKYSPMQLGRICNYWREIAWATPELWNQPFLFIHSEHLGERASLLADLASEWLARSGGLPLSLYIQMDEDDHFYGSRESFDHVHPVLHIVKQYVRRWQDLYLHLWTTCITQLRMGITGIPMLQRFNLWVIGVLEMRTLSWEFPITPRQVDFRGDDLGSGYDSMFFYNVSWAHLIDVTVDCFRCKYHITILKSAPQLTRLTIHGYDISQPIEPEEVIHLQLQYFKITGYCGSSIRGLDLDTCFLDFLSMLHFPSLKELHYIVTPNNPRSVCHCPTDFLGRLKHLQALTILSSQGEKYIDVLKDWSSLESLCLLERDPFFRPIRDHDSQENLNRVIRPASHPPDPLLSLLAATYTNQVSSASSQLFLPALRALDYRTSSNEPPWTAILNAIGPLSEIGNSHRRPLNTITIEFGYSAKNLDAALVSRLAEVKEAGIDVILKGDDDPTMDFQTPASILYVHN